MRKSTHLPMIICGFIVTAFVVQAFAQPPAAVRERRLGFVEGLLRTLIESQQESEVAHGHHAHGQPHGLPPTGRPPSGQPRVIIQQGPINQGRPPQGRPPRRRPAQIVQCSAEMTTARQQLTNMNRACGTLVQELAVEQQYIPQVKPLLADCLSIQADSQVLMQRAQVYPDIKVIRDDCRRLDRKWRVLAHRLKKVRNLSNRCTDQIAVVDTCGTQLSSACDYEPQFDRQRVIRLTAQMANDFRHLTQDVYHEVNVIPQGQEVLQDCRRLYSQVNQAQALARTASYDDLVNRYQTCHNQWRKLSRRLAKCKSDRIVHHVQEIEQCGHQFQEQLWIPVEIDMGFIQDLMVSIDTDVHGAFSNITLDEFLGAEPLCQAITACLEFRDSVHQTAECFQNNPSLEELQWDFRTLDVQWTEIQQLCRQFECPQMHHHLDGIESAMSAARDYLGDVPVMTQPQLVEVVGDMNQLCHDMHSQVEQIVITPGYDRSVAQGVRQSCGELEVAIQDLHQVAVSDCSRSHLRARDKAQRVLKLWGGVKQRIRQTLAGRCTDRQRQQCLAIRNQLEPLMIKLQVVYES